MMLNLAKLRFTQLIGSVYSFDLLLSAKVDESILLRSKSFVVLLGFVCF